MTYRPTIIEKIKQRRRQMVVHSYLYYRLNRPIISDDTWQQWAQELVELQKLCPLPLGCYDKEFLGWNGATGMHLPCTKDVHWRAMRLLDYEERK